MSKILGFVMEGFSCATTELSEQISPLTILIFLLTIFIIKAARFIQANKRLPPGPSGYPLLGMIPKIKKDFHLQLFDYSKSYGKLFSLKMGNQLLVVLSDHKLIKKALAKSEFAARPKTVFGSLIGGYGKLRLETSIEKQKHKKKFICFVN